MTSYIQMCIVVTDVENENETYCFYTNKDLEIPSILVIMADRMEHKGITLDILP
jgi:hypothetical protein